MSISITKDSMLYSNDEIIKIEEKAYDQGWADGVRDFADYLKKSFRIGINTIEGCAEAFLKEQK